MLELHDVREFLSEYYGRRLKSTGDLGASACCTTETQNRFGDILRLIPEEVRQRQYGCGSPIPDDDLTGLTVLDLGCGAGTDAFVAAKLVGPTGRVIGVDMTEEQLDIARRNAPAVARKFGFENVEFVRDYIEDLDGIEDVDLVISNCVVNLSPRKDLVFGAIQRVLRDGGEFYVSDIVCDRRLPADLRLDTELYSECLTGAEYHHDLQDVMEASGFRDVRTVSERRLDDRVGVENAVFSSVTLRGFKLDLDRRCEDYGQIATYRGAVQFRLDRGHVFEAGRPTAVCRNTARMLTQTRLRRHFEVTPELKHFGAFACAPVEASGCC